MGMAATRNVFRYEIILFLAKVIEFLNLENTRLSQKDLHSASKTTIILTKIK